MRKPDLRNEMCPQFTLKLDKICDFFHRLRLCDKSVTRPLGYFGMTRHFSKARYKLIFSLDRVRTSNRAGLGENPIKEQFWEAKWWHGYLHSTFFENI